MQPDFLQTQSEIEKELNSGEKLLWSGRPRQGLRLRASDAFVIPFSLLWCGFAIFWETSVFKGNAPFFFRLWGVPFVLIGLYMVFGRFFADARTRARTYYGVTSERIIIVSGLFSRQIKSLSLRTLTDVSLTERGDGSGTITFGPQFQYAFGRQSNIGGWPGSGQNAAPAFDLVEHVKEAYDIIRRAQQTEK
jgi:hypothetical protein